MLGAAAFAAQGRPGTEIPKRPLGRTGLEVSAMGIGGYHLGSADSDAEAIQIVDEALDAGVTFFDNAWEYHQGLSEEPVSYTHLDVYKRQLLRSPYQMSGRFHPEGWKPSWSRRLSKA